MALQKLTEFLSEKQVFINLIDEINNPFKKIKINSPFPFWPFLISALAKKVKKNFLVISPTIETAEEILPVLADFISEDKVHFFPAHEFPLQKEIIPSKEISSMRMRTVHYLCSHQWSVVVAPFQALLQGLPQEEKENFLPLKIEKGKEINFQRFIERLHKAGYERTSQIETKGDFSVRGGIVDVFPPTEDHPMRMEFNQELIVSLRQFSLISQLSFAKIKEFYLFPCEEKSLFSIKKLVSLFSYLPQSSVFVLLEPQEIVRQSSRLYSEQRNIFKFDFSNLREISTLAAEIELMESSRGEIDEIELGVSPVASFAGNLNLLEDYLKTLLREKFKVVLVTEKKGRSEQLNDFLREKQMSQIEIEEGKLKNGFIIQQPKIALLGESDIFGKERILRQSRPAFRIKSIPVFSFSELKKGDYVVHIDHGIGIYKGLTIKEREGAQKEYLELRYGQEDKLYVPTYQIKRVQKYIGMGLSPPRVYRLGESAWMMTKNRVKESVKVMADRLLKLYAERKSMEGFNFSEDTVWQKELEDSFPFEETPDQIVAIEKVKEDMEKKEPMERLVCGDVGYGKTEVALRAAFKAVNNYKQVALLVPTTILAQQHYLVFKQRFSAFPIEVAMLSRFCDREEEANILKGLREGKVDVVIGTHRLLQNDIEFKELGLLIIDEEQRFGVAHKEHLKELYQTVDVLTLSATPIPRTLYMSLTGIRDISAIETPPEDRFAVYTVVSPYDEGIIKEAMRREMSRNGQVYFIHNRIQTIEEAAENIQSLVPEARIAIAHGRMNEQELEKVMIEFLEKKADILVCTTIIESGIDIPSVNTLIVDDAERLGLAQMYQLRGRVGRSDRRAYAYFFLPMEKEITNGARKRLRVIREFTELGSGFKIAMEDLEIRGAGNLLGQEQHGHISRVGLELYSELLAQAIDEIKGKPPLKEVDIKIDLPLDIYIPEDYIFEQNQRIEAYRRIAAVKEVNELKDVKNELRDRYGEIAPPVENLLKIAELRIKSQEAGLEKIDISKKSIEIYPIKMSEDDLEKILYSLKFQYWPRQEILEIYGYKRDMIFSILKSLLCAII